MQCDLQARMSMQKKGYQSNFKLTNEQILSEKKKKYSLPKKVKTRKPQLRIVKAKEHRTLCMSIQGRNRTSHRTDSR